jgi:chemotaxis protein CheD
MTSLMDVVLHPGDFFFGGTGARVHTLLGSCVSVTVWHPVRQVGGMCHYVLPQLRRPATSPGLDGRYADHAVRMFLREIARHGTSPAEYETRMYGGGRQFPPHQRGRAPDVARDNIEAGLDLLGRFGFRLVRTDVGGIGPRRLAFDIATGEVALSATGRLS